MSKEAMSEEERRRRRNEASRRCYLKRKAELAAQAQPVGVKNKNLKAKAVEAKPVRVKSTRPGPDPIVAAVRLCKTYAKVANGIKPMINDAAEFLSTIYKSEDQRIVEKVERILSKDLGIKVSRLASETIEKTRVCVDAVSKAVKTPKFRLNAQGDGAQFVPFPAPDEQPSQSEPETEPEQEVEDESAEVPVDPTLLEKVDTGEVDKSEIEIPQGKDDGSDDEDDEDDEDELDPEDDELEGEDDEDDEDDDEDDESEEAQERRARRRRREESDSVREYETGRWEMMGEMGAQGAFDD